MLHSRSDFYGKKEYFTITSSLWLLMQERLKFMSILTTAAWLAQLGDRAERRSAEREVTGSNPVRTNTQGPVSQHLHLSGSLWDV